MKKIVPFILCAGKGTRLRPLTDRVPKPLIPFFGRAIVDYALDHCLELDPEYIVINTHYLDNEIFSHVMRLRDEVRRRVILTHEPKILGSGGCINPMANLVKDSEILIHNGDIIHDMHVLQIFELAKSRPDVPAVAAIAVPNRAGTSRVLFSPQMELVSFNSSTATGSFGTFSGVHLLRKPFIDALTDLGEFSSIDTYQKLITLGKLPSVHLHDGFWFDLGLPEQLLDAHQRILSAGPSTPILTNLAAKLARPLLIAKGETRSLHAFEIVGPCFIEDSKLLETGSGKIGPYVSISGRSKFGESCEIANAVLHEFEVPSRARISKRLCYWDFDLQV